MDNEQNNEEQRTPMDLVRFLMERMGAPQKMAETAREMALCHVESLYQKMRSMCPEGYDAVLISVPHRERGRWSDFGGTMESTVPACVFVPRGDAEARKKILQEAVAYGEPLGYTFGIKSPEIGPNGASKWDPGSRNRCVLYAKAVRDDSPEKVAVNMMASVLCGGEVRGPAAYLEDLTVLDLRDLATT